MQNKKGSTITFRVDDGVAEAGRMFNSNALDYLGNGFVLSCTMFMIEAK